MDTHLRVHIAPVGFNITRITEPLTGGRADKVYLITHKQDNKSSKYLAMILKILQRDYPSIMIEHKTSDLWDLFACLNTYKQIIRKENENHVYINVSTGSKVASIAGTLACMIWKGTPYYARINYETSPDVREIIKEEKVTGIDDLPVYSINKPKTEWINVLKIVQDRGGRLKKSDLIFALEKKGIIDERLSTAAKHSRLKGLIEPISTASDNPLLTVEYKGRRSNVVITAQGISTIKIFGDE
jgi:hypothetical protein